MTKRALSVKILLLIFQKAGKTMALKKVHFTKMHGIGNDYIYIDCFKENIENPEYLAEIMSPRRFSVGADGVILICPSDIADAKMRMFNMDGSEGKMCGNGVRCVGKYVYDYITKKEKLTVETLSGIKTLQVFDCCGKAKELSVDMGKAILKCDQIPVIFDGEQMIDTPVTVDGKSYNMTAVSMGNPHAVIFMDEIDELDLEKIGPAFENNPIFPERVNTEFVKFIDKNTLQMRVFERGSGETFACGTGACATVVAAVLCGKCNYDEDVTVKLIGGDLVIKYLSDGTVIMKGPAEKVYDGVFEYESED